MNENLNPESVARLLNRSLTQLDRPTLSRLSEARQRALAAHTENVSVPVLAGTRGSSFAQQAHAHHRIQRWGLILLLVLGMFSCVSYWQHQSEPSDDEVDIAILTDDLPIEVFAD